MENASIEKIEIVSFMLYFFTEQIRKKLALLEAFRYDYIGEKSVTLQEDSFLNTVIEATERQCILEIEQLFDHAHFRRGNMTEDNCSLKLLKELCQEGCFCKVDSNWLNSVIQRIDKLCENYEKILPLELRNKLMAHHDYNRILEYRESPVLFEDGRNLIENTAQLLTEVLSNIDIFEVNTPPYEEHVKYYKEDILKTIVPMSNEQ